MQSVPKSPKAILRKKLRHTPSSGTSRFCTMYCFTGLFPSKPGVQLTLTALCVAVSNLTAFTLMGAKGSSMTLSLAPLVSLPPGEITEHEYWPTSVALTAWISSVPSAVMFLLLVGVMDLESKEGNKPRVKIRSRVTLLWTSITSSS